MSKQKNDHVEDRVNPCVAWVLRHELLSDCIFTLMIGLTIGGITAVLDRILA